MSRESEKIISDAEINNVWFGNFGAKNDDLVYRREMIALCCLKYLTGFRCGYTITEICKDLGLISKRDNIVKKGKDFVFWYFNTRSG